jgi:hypothetical protein
MKQVLLFATTLFLFGKMNGQKVDSIYFHLYTDSLKKGQHNYINIDGKLSNGQWLPLTAKDIQFTTTHGSFQGNELVIPSDFREAKLKVKAVLKTNPSIWIERTIWIKTIPDPAILPTKEEILNNKPRSKDKKTRR